MHDYVIQNREKLFGHYLFLINEAGLSEESTVDFIGFNVTGAIFIIEVKYMLSSKKDNESFVHCFIYHIL